jgi:hypothetical protein
MSLWRKRQVKELEMQEEKKDTPTEPEGNVFFAALAMVTFALILFISVQPPPVRHNICTVAEISPDITPQERERCRRIRGHKL